MKRSHILAGVLAVSLCFPRIVPAQTADTNSPLGLFQSVLMRVVTAVSPPSSETPRTFTATLKVLKAEGLPNELVGREAPVAFQAPDRLRLAVTWDGQDFLLGRDQQEIWVHAPAKHFGLIGSTNVPLFATPPEVKEAAALRPLKLPIPSEQLMLLPLLLDLQALPNETVAGVSCRVLRATPKEEAVTALKIPRGTLSLWIRTNDYLPLRLGWHQANGVEALIELREPGFVDAWSAEKWKLAANPGDKVETVARAHLTRFLQVAVQMMGERIPPLGPATGERRVVAREGKGRLEMRDRTRVLFLKGTPEEMGRQHGQLLRKEVRSLTDHILYGVGVGSSFEKGRWFFGEIESAQKRLAPFIDERYFREMDALADASGLTRQEGRLANFFPELFHCSGFALFGKATVDGRMYHGRILDYLRGLGLEQNAVVMVFQPERGNAWVNVGYAGFVGSVTAMNEKHIAIGEMGGRGEGNWDGKPMAQLVREVMENANTLEEAVAIMRKGPRTCEYYYVISDAKAKRAVGLATTPDKFETIWPGQSHPQLPHALEDAVLMSAGSRYEELARRVKEAYGKLDAEGARDLMKRPVCMTSNIHSALFAPDTLDFWVANADSEHPAAHARFTKYNLAELLQPEPEPGQ
jgi:hypothetical protein